MTESYMNKFLAVDLSAQKVKTIPVPQWLKKSYTGGKGFGAKLLYDLLEPDTDPLGPENLLMFMTGPLTATAAPSMRACVVCKSPLTRGYLDSFFGGHFGPEIKFAGYDGIIIHGRAQKPVYLWINDDKIEFCDASNVWGQDALTANEWIKKDINDPQAKVVTIGQAGENKVGFALISCEYNRQAGRGGAGAVMGSKNLKAVAVKGSHLVKVNNPELFQSAVANARKQIEADATCQALTQAGTSFSVPWSSMVGTLPYKNFFSQHYKNAEKIGDSGQGKHLFLGKAACFACPIRCSQMGAVRTGKHAHFITDTIEYETVALLGSNLDIQDIRAVARLAHTCDTLGVDTISMGNIIGFAFEAAQKGLIKSPEKIPLEFGSVKAAQYLIDTICFQTDDLGRLLGQGVKKAAAVLGRKSEKFAMHVKGLEIPGFAPRGTPGMGLAYMTADRGACHQRGFMVGYEAGEEPYEGKKISPHGISGKAGILKKEQDFLAGTDTLVKCDFAGFALDSECFIELLQAATGETFQPDFFQKQGERIWNLIRCFNIREGFSRKDDTLPGRIQEEPVPDGPQKGQKISRPDMERLLTDYYREREWDENGHPLPETLKKLEIEKKCQIYRKTFLE